MEQCDECGTEFYLDPYQSGSKPNGRTFICFGCQDQLQRGLTRGHSDPRRALGSDPVRRQERWGNDDDLGYGSDYQRRYG